MNKESRSWTCFSQKCHEKYGYDVIGLVQACLGCNFTDAVNFLKEVTGFKGEKSEDILRFERELSKKRFIKSTETGIIKPDISLLNEDRLKGYTDFGPTLFKKFFKEETIKYFEIGGGYVDSNGRINDVIPIRDDKNNLVGCSLRDIRDHMKIDDKYKTYVHKDLVLYNLNNAKNYLYDKPLIIVEGFKSVWRLYELGIKNVVCVMGSEITPGQVALVYSYAKNGVVVMFDNDKAGIRGTINAYKYMARKTCVNTVFITEMDDAGKGLDPADLTDQQLLSYLSEFI
jgi:5S rRNA maturation endonuclease (ribonuclease M5)